MNYAEYKKCDVHGVNMPLRTNGDGKHFYSHGKRHGEGLVWCSGWGYKNREKTGPRYLPEEEIS
jgi:hypothetical protein